MLKEKNVIVLKDNQYTWSNPEYYKRLDEIHFVSPDCETFTEDYLEEKLKETFLYKDLTNEDAEVETGSEIRDKYTLTEVTEFEFNSVVMDRIITQEKALAEARTVLEKTRRLFGVA